ncbi:hypothetical protein EI94DRAFT_1797883 [Lactarius quietus]|nr:hypothetical protein EI94DRAFT_1797883 [Lactarius quietus]
MEMQGPSWDAVQLFVASRSLSGRPIQVNARAYSCHICYAGFIEPQELTTHLAHEHAYRIACPYCSDFEWFPEYHYIFREHLRREHPEIAHNHALISDSSFAFSLPFLVSRLVGPLSSLHAKDVVSPTTHGAGDSGADDILAWSGRYAWSDPDDILWPPSSVEPSSLLASFPDDT